MNEALRRAMLRARLREDDVASHLGVDPKTVRRWLSGRVPYPSNRAELADLVRANETELWPDAEGALLGRSRPEELAAVYPHRWAVPREVWARFFESAEREIGILAYSALFLAEDSGLLGIIADRARQGTRVRIVLGDPECAAVAQRGQEEGIGGAMASKVRNGLTLYRPLMEIERVGVRMHDAVLYNSIYRADDQLFVNQHAYGVPAAHSPVFCYRHAESNDISNAFIGSFEKVWTSAKTINNDAQANDRKGE